MPFLGIDHVGIMVRNIDKSINFYRDFLGLYLLEQQNPESNIKLAYLGFAKKGLTQLELLEIQDEKISGDRANQHVALLVDDIQKEYNRLIKENVKFIGDKIFERKDGTKHIFMKGIDDEVIQLIEYV